MSVGVSGRTENQQPILDFTFIAESQGQIGLISLMASLPALHLLSAPLGAAYTWTTEPPFTLRVRSDASGEVDLSIKLPTEVAANQSGTIEYPPSAGDHVGVRLRGPASRPAPTTLSLPRSYLSAAHLQSHCAEHLACSTCSTPVVNCTAQSTYTALPSEHWEELIDSWMCHGDQLLNASVTRGKEGLEDGSKLKAGEVRVADGYLVCPAEMVVSDTITASGKVSYECQIRRTQKKADVVFCLTDAGLGGPIAHVDEVIVGAILS